MEWRLLLLLMFFWPCDASDRGSSSSEQISIRCYSCTTLNADRLLSDVQDANWRRWLENVRFVPRAEECADTFEAMAALRGGVKGQECEDGVCLKMTAKEKQGLVQVWRSCIPNAQNRIRPDCTRITSSQGEMEVCTCNGNLCNGGGVMRNFSMAMLSIFIITLMMIIR